MTIGVFERELPEAVRTLVGARTGDAVYVVGRDYTIVHRDVEPPLLGRDAREGEERDVPCQRPLGGSRLLKIRLGLLDLVVMFVDGALEHPQVSFAGLPR